MKKGLFYLNNLLVLFLVFTSIKCQNGVKENDEVLESDTYVFSSIGNPYLPLWEHVPDGEPRVFEDPDNPGKFRVYIIGSHDTRYTSYCGADIRMWSAPVEDLSSWRDEGAIFQYQVDGQWDVMYAPDLVEVNRKDGKKEYYLYPHSRGKNREAMVAKGSRPDGPFSPINLTEDGLKTVGGSILGFDPAVYIETITDPQDPDYETGFRAYGYWGFQRSLAAELDPNTMYSLKLGTQVIDRFLPAGRRYGEIRDPEGTTFSQIYEGENLGDFNFFEASSIRKIGNKYVTVYSGYSGPDYGINSSNSTLRYAVGDTPLGPWKTGGVLVDSRAPVLNKNGDAIITTNGGHNTHGSLQEINGQWYVFYHRPPRSFGYARQAMVAPVHVSWDEKSVADGGMVRIRAYNPYTKNNITTVKDANGNEYKGAEVTSEGFHIYGLNPYQYYSAGYACYFSDNNELKDSWDIWDNHMPLNGVKNGSVIGFKYFGFGGLKEDTKGLKAFEGTKQGNETHFNLFLKPQTKSSFKVNVWLDGPWDNDTWKGTKIAEISIPENAKQSITKHTVDVSKFVDGLSEKHAIYLVVEGEQEGVLCNIVGLGFSSNKHNIERPIVPTVSIQVNGQTIKVPQEPIRSTKENGITGYNFYETTFKVNSGQAEVPKVTASASHQDVKIRVTQAASKPGDAVVQCKYNGLVKSYTIHLE